MKRFLNKLGSSSHDSTSTSSASSDSQQALQPQTQSLPPSSISAPTADDIFRHRYHHGTNLGSIFVLEKWLFPSLFHDAPADADSELDVVTAHVQKYGLEATKARWQQHWASALAEGEVQWLVTEAKCTSVRLPVGYFTLGPRFCRGTPFEGVAEVYVDAWAAVKNLVQRLWGYGIGTLIDLHALPGGANGESHSGTSTGTAKLWGNKDNCRLATECAKFVAEEVKGGMAGVVGIQLCNEAVWAANGMYDWHESVLQSMAQIDASIPIYVSDGWNLAKALDWASAWSRRAQGVNANPVIVDTHKYYTFSDADRACAPAQLIQKVGGELGELSGRVGSIHDHGAAEVIVGEYSCVLDEQTWQRCAAEEKEKYVREFAHAQGSRWQRTAGVGGAYFWTLKMEWMDGGEWGFMEQVKKGNLVAPPALYLSNTDAERRAQHARSQKDGMAQQARKAHEEYWNRTAPNGQFEHDLYSLGWSLGFDDADAFWRARGAGVLGAAAGEGADTIGCLDTWVRKRMVESSQLGRKDAWEWEQGFRAGITAFNDLSS